MLMAADIEVPAAGRHPRLPAARRAQDVEVARQRDRAVPGDRRLRRRRAALLRAARGSFGAGRRGLARGLRDPLQHRARQRVRQPRQPHAGDDRALPRRRGARAPRPTRRWPPSSTGSPTRSRGSSTRVELTAALDEIWRADQAAEPVRPGRGAVEAREGRAPRPTSSTRSSTRSPRACASCRVLLHPFMPGSAERLLAALGREDLALDARGLGAAERRREGRRARPAVPAGRGRAAGRLRPAGDRQPLPPRPLRAARGRAGRARAGGGRDRLATVGMNGESIQHALAAAEEHDGGGARSSAATRTRPPASTTLALEQIERAAPHPRSARSARPGLDYYRDHAPRDDQRRAFEAQLELARARRPAGGDPHARGGGRHVRDPARARRARLPVVIMHCFSAARPAGGVRRAGATCARSPAT